MNPSDQQPPESGRDPLRDLQAQIGELRGEVRQLSDDLAALRKDLKSVSGGRPALLFLVVLTLGFVLALTLASGFHWLISLSLAVVSSAVVFFLFRGRQVS